jgi:HSP20 family protein
MSTLSLWTRRDPFAEFDALFRAARETHGFVPAADVERDGDDAVVRLELPGLDAERDVTVEIDGGRLVVRGERRDERTEERGGRSLREVRYGSFRRSFGLPAHVTSDAVTASYDAGVLTVRVGGAYAGKDARQIPVSTGSPAIESGEQPAA